MDSILRDLNREQGKMQTDVDNLNRHYGKLAEFVGDYIRQTTVEWARLVASHPKAILLIVETTRVVDSDGDSYGGENEPIRFTALSLTSGELWDYLLHPTYSKAVRGAEYHGLTMEDLEDKLLFADVWPKIAEVLKDRHLIIFGVDWARSALRSVRSGGVVDDAFCLHNRCKEYYNEFYDLSLEKILGYQGIDKKREELKDSRDRLLMLAQVVSNLAAGMEKQSKDDHFLFTNDGLGDLDDHPF